VNREVAVILALGALAVAALLVSIGSFVLLWADRRDRRGGSGKRNPAAAEPPASTP
jgi:hypothetical protein